MNQELALTSSAFGLLQGVFFIGYFSLRSTSNLALARFGARVWIARILNHMGPVAAASAFVHNRPRNSMVSSISSLLRRACALAERWRRNQNNIHKQFNTYTRTVENGLPCVTRQPNNTGVRRCVAHCSARVRVGGIYILSSTWIMDHVTGLGLSGWRWMLLLEGVPAILGGRLGVISSHLRTRAGKWLTDEEKAWLTGEWSAIGRTAAHVKTLGIGQAIADPKVLTLSLISFTRSAVWDRLLDCRRSFPVLSGHTDTL